MNQKTNSRRRLLPACAGALAAAMLAPPAQAEGLGRLFFTPEQRVQFEQARARKAGGDTGSAAQKEVVTPEKPENIEAGGEESGSASVLTVNGIVQKRGGARTVWVNGVAQNADSSNERAPESLAVTVPGKTQPARVKVGQQLLLESPPQPKPAERKPARADSEEN
jgi:hypothetical protein